MASTLGRIFRPHGLRDAAPVSPPVLPGCEVDANLLKRAPAAGRIRKEKNHGEAMSEQPRSYRYYILGETRPVRIAYDEHGLRMGAETPDRETGELKFEHTLMMRVAESWEVEEIDAETFDKLCRAYPETMRARLTSPAPKQG